MRALLTTICTWILLASGSFLMVYGGMDYWAARQGQSEIAREWQNDDQEHPVPGGAYADSHGGGTAALTPQGTVPRVPPPTAGEPVARLSIPRLDTVLYVVEGTDNRNLKRGPGHLQGTVLPGEDGNCVIAGHRDTHFRVLKDIRNGDEVILEREGLVFRYRVDNTKVVMPSNTSNLKPTTQPVLNLVTCYPFYYTGSAPERFIVHAELETPSVQASR